MALVHCDPFAHYTTAQVNDVYANGPSGATVAIGAYGPNGAAGLRFTGNLAYSLERQSLSTSGAVCIYQGDLRISSAPGSTNILVAALLSGTTHQCTLDLNADRTLAVFRGSGGTKTQLGSNSTYVVPLNTHIHIGVKFIIANSGGSILVHVWEDGDTSAQVVLNVTGVDTQEGGSATWDGLTIGAGTDGDTDWSNLVVMDGSGSTANDLLGPADVWALWASERSASSLTDWTGSPATGLSPANLTNDATPDDDTTYLEETTQNQQMTVAVDPVPYPTRTIHGAQLYASVKLTTGSPSLRGIGYESAVANLGVTFAPTAAYTYLMGPYSAMPSGAAFSTAAAFDALQWGLKLTTSATGARVTQIVVALIQARDTGERNLLTGYTHTATGDDHLIAGQSHTVTGAKSQAHGQGVTVIGDRSIVIGLDGATRTVTGNGKFEVYGEIGGDIKPQRVVVAAASESVVNDTMQNDDELLLTVEAYRVYLIELMGFFTTGTSTAVDVKVGFTFPSAAVMTYAVMGYGSTATGNEQIALTTPSLATTTPSGPNTRGVISTATSASSPVWLRGVLRTAGTAGTLQFQFAQSVTTGGTPLVRQANSFLSVTKV